MVHTRCIFMRTHERAFFCGKTHFRLRQAVPFSKHSAYRPFESSHLRFFEFLPLPFCACFFTLPPPLPLRWFADSPPYRGLWPRDPPRLRPDDHAASVPLFCVPGRLCLQRTGWGGCWLSLWGQGSMWWPRSPHPENVGHWVVYPFCRAPDNAAHCLMIFHGYHKARRDHAYSYCCGHVQRESSRKLIIAIVPSIPVAVICSRVVIPSIAPRTIVSAMVCGRFRWACVRILLWVLVSIVNAVVPALAVTTIVRGTTIVVSAIVSVVIVVVVAMLIERSFPPLPARRSKLLLRNPRRQRSCYF